MSELVDQTDTDSARKPERPIRDLADRYVHRLAAVNPLIATWLGLPVGEDRLPDLSPAGRVAHDELSRATLTELDAAERVAAGDLPAVERRCGRLLRERLEADLATSGDEEYLRELVNVFGLQERVQEIFALMPVDSADNWAAVAHRMRLLPATLAGFRETLEQAAARGSFTAAPRQVRLLAGQLDRWLAATDGRGWYAGFAEPAQVPAALRAALDTAAAEAAAGTAALRDWLRTGYLPRVEGSPDGIGADRYRAWARFWTGADLDLVETYRWGWATYQDLRVQLDKAAGEVLPGGTPAAAMRHLDEHGEAVEGTEAIRIRLQQIMDEAIRELNGTAFELAPPLHVVEARIAPAGTGAPYYTPPSRDFARPGRTWLPTNGQTRFPLWQLLSTWYHEGVPGHHLQHGQWVYVAGRLSLYQSSVGGIDACGEGWALYAERLMDELGYFRTPGDRIGYLDRQLLRAIRVVLDIGLHLELPVPADSPMGAGQRWTPELARAFLAAHSGQPAAAVDAEIDRYLGLPGQAISYKLGERAWLAGRAAAQAAHRARGATFDAKSWHMAALSLGSLGLRDLTDELSRL
ncbi:DUF885 domain-containing protein [Rhizomonospora bruguierae]|uniref:DUF885 domain-containing protein n=1 Tax=Rhizomonospora bruguierae TaxID=1581705 RepID=UPI001BCDD64B|nr:DUF885 domain-containing protein [Micromonospora sp. NBRC 107566]